MDWGAVMVVFVWWLDLQLLVQSVPITTTKVVSLNPAHGEVYSIQQYVIKFVSDLRQVCGFLRKPQSGNHSFDQSGFVLLLCSLPSHIRV
jgi:hypothetical protein